MSRYSQDYIVLSKALYAAHHDLFQQWSKDNSNPELMQAAKMTLEAAQQQ